MRKGTRSCRECRRRKIKCNWDSDDALLCNECRKYERSCQAQGAVPDPRFKVAKPARSLSIKVDRFESIVQRLTKLQDDNSKKSIDSFDHLQAQLADLDHLDEQARKTSPLYGLFNNSVLSQLEKPCSSSLNISSVISFGDKDGSSNLDKLKSTIAPEANILDVFDLGSDWWVAWRHQAWAMRNFQLTSLREFVAWKLESTDVVEYSIGLMCIALAMQNQPSQLGDLPYLTISAHQILSTILTAIDTVTLTSYLSDHNILLVLLLRSKTHAESNQLRKSWLRIRHALLLSKSTLADYTSSPSLTSTEKAARERFIGSIYDMDAFLSMVLGFPSASDPNFTSTRSEMILSSPPTDMDLSMRALRRCVAIIATAVNARNATTPSPQDTTIASNLQSKLSSYHSSLPTAWWTISYHTSNPDTQTAYEHLTTQLWYWELQAFTHLPHMLASLSPHTTLCLDGARNMLRVFITLRSNPAYTVFVCACEDFQGIVMSSVLLVGLLLQTASGQHSANTTSQHQFQEDLALIAEVKDVFHYRAYEQGGGISRQGLKATDQLESCLYDPNGGVKNIVLPYFGLIKIESKARNIIHEDPASTTQADDAFTADSQVVFNPHDGNAGFYAPLPTPPRSFDTTPDALDQADTYQDGFPEGANDFDANRFQDPSMNWDQLLFGEELGQDWVLNSQFPVVKPHTAT